MKKNIHQQETKVRKNKRIELGQERRNNKETAEEMKKRRQKTEGLKLGLKGKTAKRNIHYIRRV